MNLTQLSTVLTKLYNKLGNRYLTQNFITEPFEFDVKMVYQPDNDHHDYTIQVFSNPPMPDSFTYTPEVEETKSAHGAHISVISNEFKKMYNYIDINDKRKRFVGVQFMNRTNG